MMPHRPKSLAAGLLDVLAARGARGPAGLDDLRAMRGVAASISVSAAFWALVVVALQTL